jgi:diguanylate cyclase (GGDEF)-like protein
MELPALNRDTLRSPVAEQLREGFPRLRFDAPLLEKDFRAFYVAQNVPRGRIYAIIGLVLLLLISAVDAAFGPPVVKEHVNTLRLGVLVPMIVLALTATWVPALKPYYSQIAAVGVTLAGLVVIYMCHIAALEGAAYLLAGVVLLTLYACLFLGLLFRPAVAVASLLVAGHVTLGILLGLPSGMLFYTTAILGTTTVVGAVAAYNLEHAVRTSYLEMKWLNELAERDGLTGLYNRRMFDDLVRRLWRQARREDVAMAIIFVDIDSFKVYNDLYGHQAGDDCLKKVARTMERCAKRPFDFSARYGGEEFVLVLYGPSDDRARALPERISQGVLDLAIPHEGSPAAPNVTVSVGVALARPGSSRSLTGAIQTADEALYEAKQTGKNRVVFRDANESDVETGNFRVIYRELIS